MKIGTRVKNRRLELDMTQDELAQRLGYSDKSSISRIEKSSKLTLNRVQLLADALNVSPSYLMGWEDEYNTDMNIDNNSVSVSTSFGSDSNDTNTNTYTTNNYYSSSSPKDGHPCSKITSMDLFYEVLMILKDMNDKQLKDMIRYGNFILKG